MGKRSSFKRREKDNYPTPAAAVTPLLNFISVNSRFYEPCMGSGDLIGHLEGHGHRCIGASDINDGSDARTQNYSGEFDWFITNPPWSRDCLHPIIENLSKQKDTWLLFDADWMHTKQAIPYLPRCSMIVSIGRVKWIPDSPYTGKDNCCWYHFCSPEDYQGGPHFYGR